MVDIYTHISLIHTFFVPLSDGQDADIALIILGGLK